MRCDKDRFEGQMNKHSLCGIVLPRTTIKVPLDGIIGSNCNQ